MALLKMFLLVLCVFVVDATRVKARKAPNSAASASISIPTTEERDSSVSAQSVSSSETHGTWEHGHPVLCGDLSYAHDGACKTHTGWQRFAMHGFMALLSLIAMGCFMLYLRMPARPASVVIQWSQWEVTLPGLNTSSPQVVAAAKIIGLGIFYIMVSAVMIESNKWLMQKDHFPFPVTLTTTHMVMSFLLANGLRLYRPACFPALEHIEVTPKFCAKFMSIGIPFAVSLICGNWAYRFLSVSFLQVIKQSNVVTIYVLSVFAGLEALRRCSSILLFGVLIGCLMAVQGELHFVLTGFLLQVSSSLCEATKTLIQSILMSGEAKLDPLTMVLFMAPACFIANLVPLAVLEGHQMSVMLQQAQHLWPFLIVNTCLAFILNATVALCIKQLSAVGFLLCGIVKDISIIVTSAWFLGESLSVMQQVGFCIALVFVALYSLYKQNLGLFEEDKLLDGFSRVFAFEGVKKIRTTPATEYERSSS